MAGFISLPVSLTLVSASDLPHSVSIAGGLGREPCGEAFLKERDRERVAEVNQETNWYIHELYP